MADAGLECVEWGSDVHAPYTDTENLSHLASMREEYGITCSSYGTYFRIGETPADELYGYIRAAELLGTRLIRLWCGTKGSAAHTPEEKAELFCECRRVADIAEKCGVTVAMECHNWTYTDTAESVLELMDAVASPVFRMYWQPNQFRTFHENVSHIKQTGGFVTAVHAFNWDESDRLPLADSADVWAEYLSNLDGEHPLLLEFMPDDNIASLRHEADALRRIIEITENRSLL